MAQNNLFQLAQVIADLPLHCNINKQVTPLSSTSTEKTLLARKNACIVCAICFTCSKHYGIDCQCLEAQPRRGKNLPEDGLDSRAKKLSRLDQEDYEFTLQWLEESAHPIYRDKYNQIVGLSDMTEVSLCKAHSSALYRAKKKYQKYRHHAPPSPTDSNTTKDHPSSSEDSDVIFGLAAKIRELPNWNSNPGSDFFSTMTQSTSTKRKRTTSELYPNTSASTPLHFSSQLPPLKSSFHKVVETVSLKSSSDLIPPVYYIQNLAITDTFTFQDLLSEIDFPGPVPSGKRIVISDLKKQKVFPLAQPIRSVIKYPISTHVEFCLGLSEKPSIDWNNFK